MNQNGSLSARIQQVPVAYDAAHGIEVADRLTNATGPARDLVVGAAGCAPYLAHILEQEAGFACDILDRAPEDVLAEILRQISDGDAGDPGAGLRCAKRRVALLVALADLGGVWPLAEVTEALTGFADAAVSRALKFHLAAEIARGKLPGCDASDLQDSAGMVVFAMGKMGAYELNYSSDIDLIVLFDDARHDADDYAALRKGFIRVTQRMVKTLSDVTAEGYVFRTDLRLRPNPAVTPICIGMAAAEHYYEGHGRTWERAAMIKARPCAGAIEAGDGFLEGLKPFIWRRHLDFAAIQDAQEMQASIREHKGVGGKITVPGHNVKLGRGGIREIEFFTQTRQLIGGGRDSSLRDPQTLRALVALTQKGWVEQPVRDDLSEAYEAHRRLEHRLQMLNDAQTHKMPDSPEGLDRIAAFCGEGDREAFEAELHARLVKVHDLTEEFFSPAGEGSSAPPVHRPIESYGFEHPRRARDTLDAWRALPALRSSRARGIFKRLQPAILERLDAATSPDEALAQFDNFLSGLPAGVQIFALFDANPQLLDLLVDICATAPGLARYLGRNSDVFDAVLDAGFYTASEDADALTSQLTEALASAGDYEGVLDTARIWVKEKQFRTGVHLLRGIATAQEAAYAYSDIAEACLRSLCDHVVDHFSQRHGKPPGAGAAVAAMGKLGSREMTVNSDLDLIIVYDGQGVDASDGPRPLPTPTYYARLTKAFLSALTSATAQGTLYEVDMRLRPSGQKGPVAVSLASFQSYQNEDAWTWEHLALTRARVIAGACAVMDATADIIHDVLSRPRSGDKIRADVAGMRARLAEANTAADAKPWEVKLGRGRLMDIEIFLQSGLLECGIAGVRSPRDAIAALAENNWLTPETSEHLRRSTELFATVQQITRLSVDGEFEVSNAGRGLVRILLAATGHEALAELEQTLSVFASQNETHFDRHFNTIC